MSDAAESPEYDLTLELDAATLTYPGDPKLELRRDSSLAAGAALTSSSFSLGCHMGTHVDAPAHFLQDGRWLDDYALVDFFGPGLVLDLRGVHCITAAHLAESAIPERQHLLLRTDNSPKLRNAAFDLEHAHLREDAAELLLSANPRSIGFDYYSVDAARDSALPVHRMFARRGLLVYVCLDLARVPAGAYTFHGLPIRLSRVEAAPVRAMLSPLPRTVGM